MTEMYYREDTGWRSFRDGSLVGFVPPYEPPTGPGDFSRTIEHGEDLLVTDVGPWALQQVAKGDEVLQLMPTPARGYFRMEERAEYCLDTPYVYNNTPGNHGGVVPAGGMEIDGYDVPAGTTVVQFRKFEKGFYAATGIGGNYLFRGCSFRWDNEGGGGTFNDANADADWSMSIHFCDVGGIDPEIGSMGAMVRLQGGGNHRVLRHYSSYAALFSQSNVHDVEYTECLVANVVYNYGVLGPNGNGDTQTYHLNGYSSEGAANGLTIQRCKITIPSPDGVKGYRGNTDPGEPAYGTQPGQLGYGDGSNPGRLTNQTDCIAVFHITSTNHDVNILDNYLGGSGYVLYAGGAGKTNFVVRGNRWTTKWWTDSGYFGPVSDIEDFGINGNVWAENTWADDYGSGGDGSTALADREFPNGDGPRAGAPLTI